MGESVFSFHLRCLVMGMFRVIWVLRMRSGTKGCFLMHETVYYFY
jgi:hypothetical protein